MLKRNNSLPPEQDDVGSDSLISFDEVVGIAKRQGWLVGAVGILGAGLGLA